MAERELNHFKDNTDEPDWVQIRESNKMALHIETSAPNAIFNISNCQLTNSNGEPSRLNITQGRRFTVATFIYPNIIENVNNANNQLEFTYFAGGVPPAAEFTAILTNGRYYQSVDGANTIINNVREEFMDMVVAAMNTAAGIPNLFIFTGDSQQGSGTVNTQNAIQGTVDINVAVDPAGTFFFGHDGNRYSNSILKQRWLWNPELEDTSTGVIVGTAAQSKNYGEMLLMYTRYFDLSSNILTDSVKFPNTTTNRGSGNILLRVYLESPLVEQTGIIRVLEIDENSWINLFPDKAITLIDFRLTDEYGDLLEVPSSSSNNQGTNFYWEAILVIQMI